MLYLKTRACFLINELVFPRYLFSRENQRPLNVGVSLSSSEIDRRFSKGLMTLKFDSKTSSLTSLRFNASRQTRDTLPIMCLLQKQISNLALDLNHHPTPSTQSQIPRPNTLIAYGEQRRIIE